MHFLSRILRTSWICFLLIWLLSAAAASYIRLYPLWGHLWSPTQEQATLAVVLNLKKTFHDQIRQMSPEMPPAQAEALASAKMNETLRDHNAQVRQAIEKVNRMMMQSQNGGKGDPIYLLEADPFNFYNLTENILTKGRMADVIKGNKYFNELMGAPFGYWQPLTLHPYIGLLMYKIALCFNPGMPLMAAVAFTPLVLIGIALAAFMWCARLWGLGYPAILAGNFYFVMAPVFLKRSSLGWYDTDPYNLIFPLLLLSIFFRALDRPSLKAGAGYGALLALVLIAYSLLWQGWVFLFFMTFICAAAVGISAFCIQRDMLQGKIQVIFAAVFAAVTLVMGACLYGWADFWSFFSEGAGELQKFTVKGMNLWPNLFLEVGELKKSSISDLLDDTGGPLFLLGACAGVVYALLRLIRAYRTPSALKTIIVGAFLFITLLMTMKAERFVLFALVPLSLFFTAAVEWGWSYLRAKRYGTLVAVALIALLLGYSWQASNKAIRTVLTPIFNSVWDDALTAVRDQTPADSIVNTWWPPGHFIKAVAQRRVPFDGASLSESATGYWMASMFLSTDENRAAGIVRMLNTSGNRAVDFLLKRKLTTAQAVAIISLITAQTPGQARETLKPFLNAADVDNLVLLTHGGVPHSYVLIYNELVDSNAGLVFVGRRNFQRIEAINADPKLLAAVPHADTPEFIDFLWGLSGGPAKFSQPLPAQSQDEDEILFTEGLRIKKDKSSAVIQSPTFGNGIPAGIVYSSNGHVLTKDFPGGNLNYRIVFYEQDGRPVCRLMDKDLADAMIVRLFFFDGQDLKHFKLIKSSTDLTSRTQIKVFEVIW